MINGNLSGAAAYGTGGIIALLSIAMVFVVLIVIIVLTEIISKFAGKDEEKQVVPSSKVVAQSLNLDDEDATVACLVASIAMREETKKNVQVVSVREVK